MTREMKSSRVQRDSSSAISTHRSTAGAAFRGAAATGGGAGAGAASGWTTGGAGGGLFGAVATAALRAGLAGSGLISTGGCAATPSAVDAPPVGGASTPEPPGAACGDPRPGGAPARAGRWGVASGGNADITLASSLVSAAGGGAAGAPTRVFQATKAINATMTQR